MSHPYPRSSAVGIAILGILVIIAVTIFNQQFKFNPAVRVLSESTINEGSMLQKNSDQKTESSSETSSSVESKTASPGAIVRLTDKLAPLSPPEHFDEVTLSDKIDGKAELYLPSGFKSMECQRFKSVNKDIWFEMFIYDMGLPENAFSVFSRQRRDNVKSLDIAQYAYQTENAIFLTHGHFYVEMIASAPSSDAVMWMVDLAKAFISDHPELSPKKMDVPDLFPAGNEAADSSQGTEEKEAGNSSGVAETIKTALDKESITLITTDVFGFDKLDQVYTAGYKVNGAAISAFISKRGSHEEAEKLASEYIGFLKQFGGSAIDTAKVDKADDNGVKIHAVEIMDTVEIVFSVGQFLAGVREGEDLRSAEILASEVMQSLLKESSNKP